MTTKYPKSLRQKFAHPQVKDVAEALANEYYDRIMGDNRVYASWKEACPDLTPQKAREMFIRTATPRFLDQARATLAKLLGQPGNEALKEDIAEALIMDNTVRRPSAAGGSRI